MADALQRIFMRLTQKWTLPQIARMCPRLIKAITASEEMMSHKEWDLTIQNRRFAQPINKRTFENSIFSISKSEIKFIEVASLFPVVDAFFRNKELESIVDPATVNKVIFSLERCSQVRYVTEEQLNYWGMYESSP